MTEPLALKNHSGESQIFLERAVLGFGMLIVLTLVLLARMFYLQIVQHDLYATLSDRNRIQVQSVPPIRGLIYDRHGTLIADNVPSYTLTITKERVRDMDATIDQLDAMIGLSDDEIESFKKRLARRQRPLESVPMLLRLTPQEIARVSVNRHLLPGVEVEARLVRHYPLGELMAHAVGSVRRINEEDAKTLDSVAYSGTDHLGKLGVEKFYEKKLLGTVGYQQVETDARGRVMKVLDSVPPRPGQDLTLHVDVGLQKAASEALGDRRGTVVALDPATGGSLPSYQNRLTTPTFS